MKKTGSISIIKKERDNELIAKFKRMYMSETFTDIENLCKAVVKSPSSRFWVTEERAAAVVSQMLRGKKQSPMHEANSRMFAEILRRVSMARYKRPRSSLLAIVRDVIEQPAPEFYISRSYAVKLIYKLLKKKKHSI